MKSSTRLDSVAFQLTPTRTRCDLLVTANGKTEKIATGLLDPFLAHLKTAKDQLEKGGYSIILKPEASDNAAWFTKGTIERFVRFVSTPEVIERVYTLETEIIQIKEAIGIQNNSEMALTVVRDDQRAKKADSTEGSRPLLQLNEEKAIVLYEPDSHPKQANRSTSSDENSKAQVMKVLETRKIMLQKEQGMAFARAVAAGFEADDMIPLITFAKTFGATRLMDACLKFMDLWKKKHETGQWVEIEATEVMATQPNISAMNDSGIMFANAANMPGTPENSDAKSPSDNKPNGNQEYVQGQHPQPMYAPWPVHSPPGTFPVFQGYTMQGMPYYPGYPGASPYPSPYPSTDDSRRSSGQRKARKHHSSCSEDSESEDQERENEKSGRRRKSGKVVIRNINYINSKKQDHSGTESDADDLHEEGARECYNGKERAIEGKEADTGDWQAFQTYLLQDADRDERTIDHMMEKEITGKKRQSTGKYDPLAHDERESGKYQERDTADIRNGSVTRRIRGSSDSFMVHQRENGFVNSSDPLNLNGFDNPRNGLDKRSSFNMDDDSYIVARGSAPLDEAGRNKRNAMDIGSEISPCHQTDGNERKQVNYEPHDLSLIPERETEKLSAGYDPALEFGSKALKKNNLAAGGAKKLVKDPKSRVSKDAADKRKAPGPIRKGRPTKMSPLDEARARADKLRNFKADLQKMKKEKEEEERKRIEGLKIERQKRIASKSNSAVGQSQLPAQQTKKQILNKFSPGAPRASKFSDSEPGSSSPLQRLTRRTASLGSNDYQKFPKNGKLSTNKSVSRTRRLSEPKMGNNSAPSSSVRPRRTIASRKASDAPEIKKLSAIVNYDIAKIASLPELKIKPIKGPTNVMVKGVEKIKSSASEIDPGNKNKSLCQNDIEETPVIEKTIVMVLPSSARSISTDQVKHEKSDVVSENSTIRQGVDKEAIETMQESGNDLVLVRLETLSDLVTETPKFLTSQSIVTKPYEAPYARVSSLEDPCTVYSDCSQAPPPSLYSNETEQETVKVLIPEKKISDASEKSQTKESASKGLRKLLKFGKKSQSSSVSEHYTESNNASFNSIEDHEPAVTAATTSEAFTLKNLISQDETPTAAAASQKSSRHFSILSPFKNKKTVS
ncbi:unnamed protein product [Arabidopsis arenosa]|uniref:COP1-interacting protein-related n=1 Tax=Arabidopsis arenosa TaxID=38785 RepID=A0A8S2AYK2_ARAAE|nr:unnamed protein product [Arabidopsis arenosa]